MKHLSKLIVAGAVLSLAAGPVLAQGRGNSGNIGANVGVGAGANMGGQSGLNGNFGGNARANIGAQGQMNANGPAAADRDFGRDRAEDRSSSGANAGTDANVLGSLNADHSSERARAKASSNSRVGEIATYQSDMKAALSIQNPTQRDAAITSARQQLAQATNKPLTARAITDLDQQLNIKGASPTLGASQ